MIRILHVFETLTNFMFSHKSEHLTTTYH